MATRKPLVLSSGQVAELQGSDALAASDVGFDNTGTAVEAVTVQDAIAELDRDILTFALALS